MIPFDLQKRAAGVLLHPTSLPGPDGIGDLGKEALRFASRLKDAGQTWWQMLPLNPIDIKNSPYNSCSAFAGNPLLINLERLATEGLLSRDDIKNRPPFSDDAVDYGAVVAHKMPLLRKAFQNAKKQDRRSVAKKWDAFRQAHKEWLEPYAFFMALKNKFGGEAWTRWPVEVARRDPATLQRLYSELKDDIDFTAFLQFKFFEQWAKLKEHAKKKGVGLIGDVPIFVALDSADVWSNPHLFYLDDNAKPSLLAGVPPDYFSKDGQLWGNPLYKWETHEESGYAWWISRLRHALSLFDAVRIDHFIGFYRAWGIPFGAANAKEGTWLPGPRSKFFNAVFKTLLRPLLIAEDLGVLTPEAEALRNEFHLPGMKVLQFAFGEPENKTIERPADYPENCVVYTGTHDNNTTRGWFHEMTAPAEPDVQTARQKELDYLKTTIGAQPEADASQLVVDMIRMAYKTPANVAIVPMQDILNLDETARMNTPGKIDGNWSWRMRKNSFSKSDAAALMALAAETKRT